MSKVNSEITAIAEKLGDEIIKLKDLEILGFPIPSSIEEAGAVGLVYGAIKVLSGYKESMFNKAFIHFTNEISSLNDDQKSRFYTKYNKKEVHEFGEQALLMLSKIEMMLAAKMLGKAHYMLAIDRIDKDTYYNYGHIIKQINPYVFSNIVGLFQSSESDTAYEGGLYLTLSSLGLMNEAEAQNYPGSLPKTGYKISEFGRNFYKNIVEPFKDEI